MNINLDEAIEESIKIFYGETPKKGYTKNYFFTTERIKNYLIRSGKQKGKVLSVLGSGDFVFNLAAMGLKDIDVFDTNYLSYFNFYLKRAIILHSSCNEFNELMSKQFYLNSIRNFVYYLSSLKSHMPEDVYAYYQALIKELYPKAYFSTGLLPLYRNYWIYYNILNNMYANNSDTYQRTQNNLEKLNIQFHFEDARSLPSNLSSSYDLILLSNVSDYFGTKGNKLTSSEFRSYLHSYQNLLNPEGVLINYFYHLNHYYIIPNSFVTSSDLSDYHFYMVGSNDGYILQRNKEKISSK